MQHVAGEVTLARARTRFHLFLDLPRGERFTLYSCWYEKYCKRTSNHYDREMANILSVDSERVPEDKDKRFLVATLACDGDPEPQPREEKCSNDLVDSRMRFVELCQSRHWQFDELRRAHWTTMMILATLGGPPNPEED